MAEFPDTSGDNASDVHAHPSKYYTTGNNSRERTRTYIRYPPESLAFQKEASRYRRSSHDNKNKPQKFLVDVEETLQRILEQDTDGDFQITINDVGSKTLTLGTADSGGYRRIDIRGTYMLANLLQELALAKDYGRKHIVLDEARLNENPVDRLSRMIRYNFWDGLTRRIDADSLEVICPDPKNRSSQQHPIIYVPRGDPDAFDFYCKVASSRPQLHLQVEYLPQDITPDYVRGINDRPGLLTLAMRKIKAADGTETMVGELFVVPGGRFNEMYGWDSYFAALGLLVDGRVALAKSMVENFAYQIKHYGKILNANRSYYLTRSQPPFLTDMALKVYERLDPADEQENKAWLRRILKSAIKEYWQVWMSAPRLDPITMLSRYRPNGKGIPPETEASHFDHVIAPFARKHNVTIEQFNIMYNNDQVNEPELDDYFLHDRAVRESGHDTTYRFDKVCANLATVDLNSLLYKYETDIADAIDDYLDGILEDFDGMAQYSKDWTARANQRRDRMNKYLWNEKNNLYYDYDTVRQEQITYESATAFWTMWAGCASEEQAQRMASHSLHKFEVLGGLVSGTESSRGEITLDRPNRQWDFPFGWAPHQMMAWVGFEKYGMRDISRRLAYRWLYTITKSFVDFNGVVPEKYDVVSSSHKVQVEYGNVGTDFKFVPREGFGWMNASYQVGLSYLNTQMRRALGTCTLPDLLFEKALALEHRRSETEQEAYLQQRRKSTLNARQLTRNGSIDAAITRIPYTSPPVSDATVAGSSVVSHHPLAPLDSGDGDSYFTSTAPFR
ncbi:trehalase-domain-containing protein [Halteromyces radiatus]|uniref:trehalase-domain-containing protein n=1 Tax=Halteromyces radiatus TaxID=101107 RepID=UPI00222008B1|nr:trehalase-domain-containing protein [Halteromyces radiatus]KAI8079745.1 trehalase-domain-containing protein [Halteromyces radiatus]